MKILKYILISVFFIILIPPLLFTYEEYNRARLLDKYEAQPDYIESLLSLKSGDVGLLMRDQEVLVCVIDGYADAQDIQDLNQQQRQSIPKSKLPSEGLTWYLLFFKDTQVSRIYLFDHSSSIVFNSASKACAVKENEFIFNLTNLYDIKPTN
jgi:hypothetical protein